MSNPTYRQERQAFHLWACVGFVVGLLVGMVISDLHTIGVIKAMDTVVMEKCRNDS